MADEHGLHVTSDEAVVDTFEQVHFVRQFKSPFVMARRQAHARSAPFHDKRFFICRDIGGWPRLLALLAP